MNAQWIRGVAFVGVASAVAAALAWMSGKFGLLDVVAFAAAGAAIYLFPEVAAPDLALTTWLYSGFYMVVAVWLVCYGVRHDERFVVNIALVAFGAEALYIYLRTFDTLLNQSMFFAVGGVVLIVLGVTIEQIRRQLLRSDSGETGEEATA